MCQNVRALPRSPPASARKHGKTSAISDLCQNLYGKTKQNKKKNPKTERGEKMSLHFPSGLILKRNLAAESDWVSVAKHVQNEADPTGEPGSGSSPLMLKCNTGALGNIGSQNIEFFSKPSSYKHLIYPSSTSVAQALTRCCFSSWSISRKCWLFALARGSKNVG